MKCLFCGSLESKVVDSRSTEEGLAIRRRRECIECGRRFTTYEKIEEVPLVVVKSDGKREVFDRSKIIGGLLRAGVKRQIELKTFEELVDDMERELRNSFIQEVNSSQLGKMVLERLRGLDEVAYVRFASVYRKFQDIQSFKEELDYLFTIKMKPTRK
ncbi:transcriptional regulator NrdR [Candidatus Contubernalis alkaliaceticus]|uniref:transcriptional regulator NrdR n=1 Tax=Candidatus Contubernalis alkaliaceticus TaxID=338645 RepID=UPI001F4BFEA9|nr:transcriptional regulator NrdR [Candidatus Contubernalis alkalaceticus]UNC92866.1 transcriptional repressor NrdR [Candidatus Contubernalis alkalaceticus]